MALNNNDIVHIHKIPPNLPLPKGGIIPRGARGDFFVNVNPILTFLMNRQNMNSFVFIRKVLLSPLPSAFLLVALFTQSAAAVDCEIVKADKYQKSQQVIVTDWHAGIPYKKQTVETYQCAHITFKNIFWQDVYSTDIEVTAVFEDQRTISKKTECEKKRLEFGDTYSCSLCFENESPINDMQCVVR